VLPKKHPDSTIHASHVVETCQTCHEGADERFAASYTHESASLTANPINRMIRNVYWVLIAVVIGGMAVHNLIILRHFAVRRRRVTQGSAWVQRFTSVEITQHMLLAGTFVLLVVTGFALRFPDAWWVGYLGALGMTETVRANLHRIVAILMVATSIIHIVYLAFTRRGRTAFRDMTPDKGDVVGLVENMSYHMGRTSRPPRFGRFDYTQKAEYWALIWGTVLMAVTGVVLWIPELAVKIFPAWIVSASQTIHYYEAWLATLAIVVWHLFFVIFHPEEYPMNWTWLDGKMSESSVRTHHAQWYDDHVRAHVRTAETRQDPVSVEANPKAS
jgi:formate dehydrogenase gamma subunit